MDGHAVLAALRGKLPSVPSERPAAPIDTDIVVDNDLGMLADPVAHHAETVVPDVAPLQAPAVVPPAEVPVMHQSRASTKRAYKPNRPSRKGVKQAHKPHSGQRDGMAAVRKRAATLTKRIGVRVQKLAAGGGLPKPVRKAVRRDAVLDLAGRVPGPVSCKPASSAKVADAAWEAGVARLTCGASNERFELLRRLSLGNLAFVASMQGATVAKSPDLSGAWWRQSVARGWQLRLHAGDVVIAGGRAKWHAGGAAGGGSHVVVGTALTHDIGGFVLGKTHVICQDMVAEAGVFFEWNAASGRFFLLAEPLIFSAKDRPPSELSAQALPPLPQDTDTPAGADRLDALVVLPLGALSRCAEDGHSPVKHGLGDVMWVLDEPHPRAIRKAFYRCEKCQASPVGEDGFKIRRFRKVPTVADICAYFPKVADVGMVFQAGYTYYTIFFLIALASHFCLRPQINELQTWLAERWGLASLGLVIAHSLSEFGTERSQVADDAVGATGDVPWMLDALRNSEVLIGLVERFVSCFLDGLCEQVESEAWLADSAIFGADVCIKLAKVVVHRIRGRKGRVVRLYTGVLLHMGVRGLLLSVPMLVRRETNQAYKLSLKPRLARLRRQASQLGMPNAGLPMGAFVDTLGFEAGLTEAVREEYHGIVSAADPSRALADGFQVGKDGSHLNWHLEKYASKLTFDYELGVDCHRDMIARHNNPDPTADAQRVLAPGSWQNLLVLVPVLQALLCRWAGAAREYYRANVAGQEMASSVKIFLERSDVVIHPLWDRVFPKAAEARSTKRRGCARVPRVFVERLAHVVGAILHAASHAWGYTSDREWTEEVECFRSMFSVAVYSVGHPSWLEGRREEVCESEEVNKAAPRRQTPLVTEVISKHLDNLLTARIRHGLRVGRELALVCAQAGVQKASGTTDIDSLCHELEVLMLRRQVTTLSPERAQMIFKTLFLRVHSRRQLKGALPIIAQGQTTLGLLVLQIQQLLMLGRSPEHLAGTIEAWSAAQPKLARDGGGGL